MHSIKFICSGQIQHQEIMIYIINYINPVQVGIRILTSVRLFYILILRQYPLMSCKMYIYSGRREEKYTKRLEIISLDGLIEIVLAIHRQFHPLILLHHSIAMSYGLKEVTHLIELYILKRKFRMKYHQNL